MQSEQTQSPFENEQPAALLRGLNSYKRPVREATMRQVRAVPPERLLLLMREGASLYRKRYRLSTCVELIFLVLWLPISLALYEAANLSINVFSWSLLFVVFITIAWHISIVPWRMYRVLVGVLEHANDLHLIGPAISMYVRPDDSERTRNVLAGTLCRLLPQLRSDHENLLTPDQMRDMLSLLSTYNSSAHAGIRARAENITLSVLKALAQIGNANAIPAVRNLTSPIYNYSPEIREAAERCLEHLYINAGQHREKQTLLRASSSNKAATPDTLLRPASGNVDTAADQLLRPEIYI